MIFKRNFIIWEVKEIYATAPNTYTYVLRSLEDNPPVYQAGQFLTFQIDYEDKIVKRSYSICSTPGIDKDVAVLIKKRYDNGIADHLHETLEPGSQLLSYAPAGRFTLDTHPDNERTIIFVVNDEGIAPAYSLIKKLMKEEPKSKAHLIYESYDEENLIFHEELVKIQIEYPQRLLWKNLFRSEEYQKLEMRMPQGLSIDYLTRLVSDYDPADPNILAYITGTNLFLPIARVGLRLHGFPEEKIIMENLRPDIPSYPQEGFCHGQVFKVAVHHRATRHEFLNTFPESITESAIVNLHDLPFSCSGGTCGECAVYLEKGEVEMVYNDVLKAKDLKEGMVLLCTCYPKSDVEFSYPNYVYLNKFR